VRWGLLSVLLLLAVPASAARIVVTCYDGASSASVGWGTARPSVRFSGCDLDGSQNGSCLFQVSIGARSTTVPHLFKGTLAMGHRRRLWYADTRAVVRCRPGPEPISEPPCEPEPPPGAVTYTCQDAVLADPAADPACDTDRACDDSCTFGFHCPTCCGCGAPCFNRPAWEVQVPVGCRRVLAACDDIEVRPALVLECQPRPAGTFCPTTTTTLLPIGSCRTDEDCAILLPECHHCELGHCQGFPTFNPNRSISTVECPIPIVQ